MLKKNSILTYEIVSTIMIMILGVILHYVYDWSNNNTLVGIVSPIDESVWEHLKLLFFPMTLFTIIVYLMKGKDIPNYLCSKVLGIISSMIFTVIAFYTYSGILGSNYTFIDISLFFIAVIIGQVVAYRKIKAGGECNTQIAWRILVLVFMLFTIFTFVKPEIGLFMDPLVHQSFTQNHPPRVSIFPDCFNLLIS